VPDVAERPGRAWTEDDRRTFIRRLNDRLPKKRAIAQGLWRDLDGRILLCELTYKRELDLPGGVVDPGESPAEAVRREIREEIGAEVLPERLLVVNWLPPWRGWDDATLFLFDLGLAPQGLVESARLLDREIRALHWLAPDALDGRVAAYTARMLRNLPAPHEGTAYLENSSWREGP
jgi:8-oxo-dGTP diphosphatase